METARSSAPRMIGWMCEPEGVMPQRRSQLSAGEGDEVGQAGAAIRRCPYEIEGGADGSRH